MKFAVGIDMCTRLVVGIDVGESGKSSETAIKKMERKHKYPKQMVGADGKLHLFNSTAFRFSPSAMNGSSENNHVLGICIGCIDDATVSAVETEMLDVSIAEIAAAAEIVSKEAQALGLVGEPRLYALTAVETDETTELYNDAEAPPWDDEGGSSCCCR